MCTSCAKLGAETSHLRSCASGKWLMHSRGVKKPYNNIHLLDKCIIRKQSDCPNQKFKWDTPTARGWFRDCLSSAVEQGSVLGLGEKLLGSSVPHVSLKDFTEVEPGQHPAQWHPLWRCCLPSLAGSTQVWVWAGTGTGAGALQSSLQASLPQRGPPHPLPDAQQQFAALCSWQNTRTRDTSARRVWITGHCQWGGKKRAINLEIYSVILP